MHKRFTTHFLTIIFIGGGLFLLAGATESASGAPASTRPAVCEDFVEVQLENMEQLLAENNYERALRVANVTIQRCRIPRSEEALMDVYRSWFQYAQNNSTSQLADVLSSITSNEHVTTSNLNAFSGTITSALERWVGRLVDQSSFSQAHRYCERYRTHSDNTFRLDYLCGTAAYQTENHDVAIAAYERIVNDWDDDQSYVSWDEAASDLKELYMITTEFDDAFDIAKRLAIRDPTPEQVLSSVITLRGQMLSPIAHHGNVLFEGVTSDEITTHVRREMERIRFPNFVVGTYLMTRDARSDVIFYDSGTISPPSTSELERLSGNVTMLESGEDPEEAWLISPVDAGYFVVQFESRTSSEENALLEDLLADIQNEQHWEELVDQQLSRSYSATGSAVATLIGGAYLASEPLDNFNPLFEESNALLYFAVQDENGSVIHGDQFSRDNLEYDSDLWDRTTTTPALYHHETRYAGRRAYEVVWPNYQDDEWVGVVRIGIRVN